MLELERIDLSSLCEALEDHSDDMTWYFDPATGSVNPRMEGDSFLDGDDDEDEDEDEDEEDERSLVVIEPVSSREGYGDMEDFIATVRDPRAHDLLDRAIAGRGAFRRFKDTLFEFPDLRKRWFEFHDLRMEVRAIEWLAWEGYIEQAAADRAIAERAAAMAGGGPEDRPIAHAWHPQAELLSFTSAEVAREPLERLGRDTWGAGLDFLYDQAMRRAIGPHSYAEFRREFFGPSGEPGQAPDGPSTYESVLAEFTDRIAPHMLNAQNPRALPYFTPPALPISIAGETLAQWTNQGVDIWACSPAASLVEEEVVRWLCDLVGYGADSFGVLTSGGVMANVMAMTVARDVHLPGVLGLPEGRKPRGRDLEGLRVYASDQTHFSIRRALDVLGFPPDTMHLVESDPEFRLRAPALEAAIAADRAAGLTPFAVSAVTGSTNTGSVDPLPELAPIAEREGLWLHVDAAYGGAARLSSRDRDRVQGLELADSITLDPHKWFFQPHDIGGVLVKRREHLERTFHTSPEYYMSVHTADEPLDWYRYSLEGTRRFRALKLWCSWKFLGTEGFGRLIDHTLELTRHLVGRITESDDFELVTASDPDLSVVCFRHVPEADVGGPALDGAALDRHQDELQRALELSGEGWLSTTTLRGRTYLRAGIVNYQTTPADIDALLATLRRLASEAGLR